MADANSNCTWSRLYVRRSKSASGLSTMTFASLVNVGRKSVRTQSRMAHPTIARTTIVRRRCSELLTASHHPSLVFRRAIQCQREADPLPYIEAVVRGAGQVVRPGAPDCRGIEPVATHV